MTILVDVGDGNSNLFWINMWIQGMSLKVTYNRLFELAKNKLATTSDMFVLGWGVRMVRRGSGVEGCLLGRMSCWGSVLHVQHQLFCRRQGR